MFARVVLPLSRFDAFTYQVPSDLIGRLNPGAFVTVPFRRGTAIGVVAGLQPVSDYQGKIKTITELRDEPAALPPDLWSTLEWISRYYATPLGLVLKTALPMGFAEPGSSRKVQFAAITSSGKAALAAWTGRAPAQQALLSYLARQELPSPVSGLSKLCSSPLPVCRRLAQKGWITLEQRAMDANPLTDLVPARQARMTLSAEQQTLLSEINQARKRGGFAPFLLQGVTGSGKTEVYLQAAREVLADGGSVLVLVPEISLTPQVATRFKAAFGQEVALWHSHLSRAERTWTWRELLRGRFSVVVGARSALFAPLDNLRLIVVDEEQEGSFKQEDPAPRYNARDAALMRGRLAGALVLLASATPSVESYYNGLIGRYSKLSLSERFDGAAYPLVRLVDLKTERQRSQNYNLVLSEPLVAGIEQRLQRREQVILLQNIRGYAPLSGCNDCGFSAQCPNCAVPFSYHKNTGRLHCHYCGSTRQGPEACPECGSPHVYLYGVGTEQVEEVLQQLFPQARVARMDSDTTRRRGAHARILEAFAAGEVDILLGTQMIAKGLDFDRVTLVGVVNSDTGLTLPDFRAGERTFQLVYQVCGRSGRRRDKPGEAIIQTNHPEDVAIKAAARLDAHRFYNQVLAERRELLYPPFSRLIRLLVLGRRQEPVWERARELRSRLTPLQKGITLLGPASAPFERLRGQWRVHLLIKSDRELDPDGKRLHRHTFSSIPRSWMEGARGGVRLKIDVDPVSLL